MGGSNALHTQAAGEGTAAPLLPQIEGVDRVQIATAAAAPPVEIIQAPEIVFVHRNGGNEQPLAAECEGVKAEAPREPSIENRRKGAIPNVARVPLSLDQPAHGGLGCHDVMKSLRRLLDT